MLTVTTEANAVDTLQSQFSGYGSTSTTVIRCLDRLGIKEPLEHWSDETVENVVNAFIDEKFPTVFALNKIDHPDSDKVSDHSSSPRSGRYLHLRNEECQQDCQNAGSESDRTMLCYLGDISSKTDKAELC